MSLKEQARKLVNEIDQLRQQAEKANILTVKALLEKMGQKQSELNRVIVEVLCHD